MDGGWLLEASTSLCVSFPCPMTGSAKTTPTGKDFEVFEVTFSKIISLEIEFNVNYARFPPHKNRGHSDAVDQLIWHPTDADLLATASGDRTVRIWDYRSAKSVATVNTKGKAQC